MQNPCPHIDLELIRRLSDGDEEAFRIVFNRYRTKVYLFSLHMLESDIAAEEVVQEVFMRIWTSRHKLATVADIDAYFFIAARNRALDHIKKRKKETSVQQEWALLDRETGNDTDETLDLRESARLIELALRTLSPQQERIFRMSKEQGLKRREIAVILGISENTVKCHLNDAIKSIKQYLHNHGDIALLFILWTHL